MIRHTLAAIAVASLSIFATSSVQADQPVDNAAFAEINDRFNAAAASADLEAMLALYADDVTWIAPNAPKAKGLDTPRGTYSFVFDNDASLSHTLDQVFVSDDGSLAVMIGGFDFAAPKLNLADTGTYLFVLAPEEGGWTIIADMFNSDQPAP